MHFFLHLSNIHCIYVLQLLYPFICQWTSRLLPCPSCCKQCYSEHWDTCVFLNFGLLRVYAQYWDCWVMWWFYSQFFKESPYCVPQWLYQYTFPPTVQVQVDQSCLTLCNPMNYSLPGSSVHEFSSQEYQSGQPFPSPEDLYNPGIQPRSPALQEDSLPSELPGKPESTGVGSLSLLQIFPTQGSNWGLLHWRRILYQLSYQRSPTVQEGSLFSTSSTAFIVCKLFDDGRSDWCEVISHGSFDLHFFNNERC